MYGYIYKTTNLINGKIYIGQHKCDHLDESYYGSGTLLQRAIKKYGIDSFEVKLLEICDSSEQLNSREQFYIKAFNSQNPNIGYNITNGGEGTRGYVFTEDVRAVMSEKAKLRPHPPTTLDRIYVHRGAENRCIEKEQLDKFLAEGFVLGKYIKPGSREAWNKGKTKDTSPIVAKYATKRAAKFEVGPVGCYGVSGDKNVNRKKFLEKLHAIDSEEFLKDYNEKGKCFCLTKYHFGPNRWKEICTYFNITKSNNKTWKNHGNSLLKGQS